MYCTMIHMYTSWSADVEPAAGQQVYNGQGCEFALCSFTQNLFTEQQWAIRSCQPLKKSDHEQITLRSHRALKKSDTRELLSLLFKKERREWLSLSLSKTVQFAGKNYIFHNVFDIFSLLLPFLCPRENLSRRSLLRCSLQKSDVRKLLPLLFTKEWFPLFLKRIDISLFCSQKTSNSQKKSKFPNLTMVHTPAGQQM